MNAAWNKYVFNNDLKQFIVLALFHRKDPVTMKDPSPYELRLEIATCNVICLDDLSDLADTLMDIKLHR